MKRTIAIKLAISESEAQALAALQDEFSAACNRAAAVALAEKERNRIRLHHLCYYDLRNEFPKLGAQMCCNAIAKTAQALKSFKHPRSVLFKNGCSVHFDKRTYSLKGEILSLFTLQKRIRIQLEISPFHKKFLDLSKIKEAELVRKGKRWFFHLVLDLPDVPLIESSQAIGVDLGENVLAATSTGKLFGGGALRAKETNFWDAGNAFKAKVLKQRLRHISGREKRAVRHVNHCVAIQIVSEARTPAKSLHRPLSVLQC